ncbi:MAG: CapA family protein [Clostridium perfringens]
MDIIIGADFVPTQSNFRYFKENDEEFLLGNELKNILHSADLRIFNLEIPLCDNENKINKHGPCLLAPVSTASFYKQVGVDIFTIANNHIMDQGETGFKSTLETLKKINISTVGGGINKYEASEPYILTLNDKKVGVYACAEHEFSIATDSKCGANGYDPIRSYKDIENIKKECDYIIVLYHGGKEHYRYPSPKLQDICRNFVDAGADIVICQHSHCIGCKENYKNSTIVYGQGNFLFDNLESDYWKTGLLIKIKNLSEIEYIPIIKEKNSVRLAKRYQREEILSEFEQRSIKITCGGFVANNFENFSSELIFDYLWDISGASNSRFMKIINKLSGYRFYKFYVKRKFKTKDILALLSRFECETHREIIISGLKHILGEG